MSMSRGLVFLVLLLICGAFFLQNIDAPFGTEGVPTELAVYCEVMSQAWDEVGFVESLGMPMLAPVGETVAERRPYIHHPPAGFWPNHAGRALLGKSEAGYRIFPILATLLTAVLLHLLVRPLAGTHMALLAALSFLALPFTQLYGAMPNSEPFTLLWAVLLLLARRFMTRRPSPMRAKLFFLVFLLGTQIDWQFYFMAPALLLAEGATAPKERRWRPLLRLFPLGVLGFFLVIAHMLAAVGIPRLVFNQIKEAVLATQPALARDLRGEEHLDFLSAQSEIFLRNFGSPGVVLLGVLLLVLVFSRRWRRDPLSGSTLTLVLGGLLTVVVFNRQAATHEYFWNLAAAGIPLVVVQAARILERALLRLGLAARGAAGIALLLPLVFAAWSFVSVQPRKAAFEKTGNAALAAGMDEIMDLRFRVPICITSPEAALRPLMLYSRHRWAPPIFEPDDVLFVLREMDAGRAGFRRLVVLVAPASRARWPRLFTFLEEESRRRGIPPVPAGGVTAFIL